MGIPYDYNPMGYVKANGDTPFGPTSGLMLWHSLTKSSFTAPEIGDEFTIYNAAPSAAFVGGLKCAYFDGSVGLYQTNVNYWETSSTELTFSAWAKFSGNTYNQYRAVMGGGRWTSKTAIDTGIGQNGYQTTTANYNVYSSVRNNDWHHVLGTLNKNGRVTLYLDGVSKGYSGANTNWTVASNFAIGLNWNSNGAVCRDNPFLGYIAGVRVYNRVLTNEEIALLATEYNPEGTITASDLSFSLYQKNETYGIS